MNTPKTTTLYEMELNDHAGPESLDAIATRVYGRPYHGQQTGDMLPNDSYHVYEMTQGNVDQWNYDMEEKRHYLGLQRVAKGTGDHGGDFVACYAEGVNWFDYWLALKWDPEVSYEDSHPTPGEQEDARGHTYKYDFEVFRQAPTIQYVLADLIKRGELPYGRYLIRCWW